MTGFSFANTECHIVFCLKQLHLVNLVEYTVLDVEAAVLKQLEVVLVVDAVKSN